MITKAARAYLAAIGRRGGRKSRRALSRTQARQMVAVRMARSAYRKFHARCFWSFKGDLPITVKNSGWVAEQLRRNGSLAAWRLAHRIQSLLDATQAREASIPTAHAARLRRPPKEGSG